MPSRRAGTRPVMVFVFGAWASPPSAPTPASVASGARLSSSTSCTWVAKVRTSPVPPGVRGGPALSGGIGGVWLTPAPARALPTWVAGAEASVTPRGQ